MQGLVQASHSDIIGDFLLNGHVLAVPHSCPLVGNESPDDISIGDEWLDPVSACSIQDQVWLHPFAPQDETKGKVGNGNFCHGRR